MSTSLTAPMYTDVAGAATHFAVTPWTIRRWIRAGTLPAVRVPGGQLRIRLSDLDAAAVPVPYASTIAAIRDWLDGGRAGALALVGPARSGKTTSIRTALGGRTDVTWTTPGLLATRSGFMEANNPAPGVIVIEGGHFDEPATTALETLSAPIAGIVRGHVVTRAPVLIEANELCFSGEYADSIQERVTVLHLDGPAGA
ncbi:helix-turn-helix domain-containing protein [Tsukamurella pseudospumae]|uniref:Helix-turn-helix domain-containing protein n=1 Tax=Tsukamurella pseudospumae TaxID=239498 RepID=A0A138AEJ4_9ACTN|nr:helix-turn-helix domain-containing protein [Tsukamurella pseudospumae]KXP08799.1 hypothetical protein AXK60_09035 [Tsukamurella pseudospumae]